MGKVAIPDPTETMKMIMSRGAGNVEYRVTITTKCEEHKSHTVTILGDGGEVFGAADAAIRVLEDNKAEHEVHFYKDNMEVPWQRELNILNMWFALDDMLNGAAFRPDIADLPF